MEGLDDIGLTLRHESKITEFEKTRPAFKHVGHDARAGVVQVGVAQRQFAERAVVLDGIAQLLHHILPDVAGAQVQTHRGQSVAGQLQFDAGGEGALSRAHAIASNPARDLIVHTAKSYSEDVSAAVEMIMACI